jgi:hypothetical protein
MMETMVAIEMRDDAGRYCSPCGTKAVALYYGESLATATEAASALEEAGDGGGWCRATPMTCRSIPRLRSAPTPCRWAACPRTGV